MKHPAITSAVFKLIETFELDIELAGESFPTRVEIYQAEEDSNLFRCRLWQSGSYRIQSSFPQEHGVPAHEASDELVLVECSHHLRCDWDPSSFQASSPKEARHLVEEALLAFLEHATARPAV